MNRHIEAFSFDGYSPEDESRARDAMQSLSEKQSKLDLLGEKLESKAVLLETTVSDLEKFREGIETLKNKQSAKNAEVRLLKNQVVKLKKEEFLELPGDKLRLQQEDFSRQYQQLTLAYDQLEKELQEKVAIKDRLWGQLGEIGKQLENYNSDLKARELKLGELLAVSTFKNEEEVRQVLSYAIDVEKEKTAIANFYNSLHAAEELFKQVSSKAEGKSYDKDEHEVVQKEIREIKQELDARKDELSTYRKILADLERDMQKYRELHAGLEKLNLRAENLRALSNLFRSSGFVNYVSSVYLHNLLNNANQRFHRLTRQKLMLELTESNNFQVRDFMNNGEVRSVKTLSGGQTFQAALCLALSLADNIQHLTKSSRNFFFLDEGFGSLDKESLNIVFETLKSLRKENRVVGVISHVEEMQQEINAYLKIINDEEKGSLVKKSWLMDS